MTRFAFVAAERANHAVVALCRAAGASGSGFYAWLRAIPAAQGRAETEAGLRGHIARIFAARRSVYGSPRVHAELGREGRRHSRRRVARLMRELGLCARRGRRPVPRTTDSRHDLPVAPNLLDRNFAAERPGTVWLADISYLPTGEGWLYLAAIEDLATREIPPVPLRGPEGRLWLVDGRPPAGGAVRRRPGHGPAPLPARRGLDPPQRPRGATRVQGVVATPA